MIKIYSILIMLGSVFFLLGNTKNPCEGQSKKNCQKILISPCIWEKNDCWLNPILRNFQYDPKLDACLKYTQSQCTDKDRRIEICIWSDELKACKLDGDEKNVKGLYVPYNSYKNTKKPK